MSQPNTIAEATNQVECIIPVLNVRDLEASIRFYSEFLGFKLDWQAPGMASVSRDGHAIMLAQAQQGHAGTWVWIGGLDVDALHDRCVAKGVKIRESPTNYSWAYEMKIEDPDGHVLRIGIEPRGDRPIVPG